MNYEVPTTENLTNNKSEALDERWHKRAYELMTFDDHTYFEGDKNEWENQKRDFMNEKIRNPLLQCTKINQFNIEDREEKLLQFKKEVISEENNEIIQQVYRWKINEKIAQVRMMKAARDGNDKKFSRYSRFIYGMPSRDIYNYTMKRVEEITKNNINNENEIVRGAAKRLLDNLSFSENATESAMPDIKNLPKPKDMENEKEYNAEEIKKAFDEAIGEQKLAGWEAIIDKESQKLTIRVNQETKKIKIPPTRIVKETKLKALMVHELGTHALRRDHGERSKLKLLGIGVDRHLKGEEGVSRFEEMKITGADDFAGFGYHLAISLAVGMDGKPRDFRDVYNILRDYYFIKSKKDNKDEAWEKSKEEAWKSTRRTFLGSTGNTPGKCFTRDIVYREGNIGVWDLVQKESGEMKRIMVGKYDPTNCRHIWILEQLGISEKDLEMLEK